MNKTAILSLGLLALTLGAAAQAGDPAAGKAKADTCAGCHGMGGRSNNPDYPNLAGQKENYLVKALKAYRDGRRKDAVMSGFASGLSDADIADLAAYYASQK